MPPTALIARAGHPLAPSMAGPLARDGYDVAIAFDQNEDPAQDAADTVRDQGQGAVTLGGRVGDPMVARQLIRRTAKGLSDAPSLVIVLPRTEPLLETPSEQNAKQAFQTVEMGHVEPVLQADLKGPWSLLTEASRRMPNDGSILLTAPPTNLQQGPLGAPTNAAANALDALVPTAANALDPIQVNLVHPGNLPPPDAQHPMIDDALDGIADAMTHLATSPSHVTGQTYRLRHDPLPSQEEDPRSQEDELDLSGIEKRVEPPDPEDRIVLDEPGEDR